MSTRPTPRISWAETNSVELSNYQKLVNFIAAFLEDTMPHEKVYLWQIGYEYSKALDLKKQFLDIANMVIAEKKMLRQAVFAAPIGKFDATYIPAKHAIEVSTKFVIFANVISETKHALTDDLKDLVFQMWKGLNHWDLSEQDEIKLHRGITGNSNTLAKGLPYLEWANKYHKHKRDDDIVFFGQPDFRSFFPF